MRRALLLMLLPLAASCAPGAPPPGPVDVVREIFDPSYDYTESPSTWQSEEQREAYQRERAIDHGGPWQGVCAKDDLTCSHEGVTVCCAPYDRCCAAIDGPYCCEGHRTRRDLEEEWVYD